MRIVSIIVTQNNLIEVIWGHTNYQNFKEVLFKEIFPIGLRRKTFVK